MRAAEVAAAGDNILSFGLLRRMLRASFFHRVPPGKTFYDSPFEFSDFLVSQKPS
jgi:hypothetical protein